MPQNTLHRQLNRNLNLYLSQGFLSWFIISWPIEILYFAQILESYTLAMSLFALQNLCLVFFELPLNWLADKYGRKNLCILGALSLFVGYLCYSFADGYFLLFFGAIFCGISRSLHVNTDALIHSSLQYMNRLPEYEYIRAKCQKIMQIGLGIAALVSIFAVMYSLRLAVQITLIPLALSFVLSLFLIEAPFPQPRNDNFFIHLKMVLKYIQGNRRLSGLALGESLRYGLNEEAFDFNAAFFKQFVPVWSLGIFRALGLALKHLGSRLSSMFSAQWGISKTTIRGAFADSIINIVAVLMSSFWSLFVRLGAPFCNGVREPLQNALIKEESPDRTHEIIISLMSLGKSLIYALCALFIGIVADLSNPYWALLSAYVLCLLSNWLYQESLKEE